MQNFNSFAELAAANGTPVYQPFTANTDNARTDTVTNNRDRPHNDVITMQYEMRQAEDALSPINWSYPDDSPYMKKQAKINETEEKRKKPFYEKLQQYKAEIADLKEEGYDRVDRNDPESVAAYEQKVNDFMRRLKNDPDRKGMLLTGRNVESILNDE